MTKRAPLALACLAGALVNLGQAQAGAVTPADAGGGVRSDVRRILVDEWLRARKPQREVEEALVGLGRPAIPVLFRLLSGEDEEFFAGAEGFELFRGRTVEGMLETCSSVLAALPDRDVVAHLERRLDNSPSLDLRWAAIVENLRRAGLPA